MKKLLYCSVGAVGGFLFSLFFVPSISNGKARDVIRQQDAIIANENYVVKKQQLFVLKHLDAKNFEEIENWLVKNLREHLSYKGDTPESKALSDSIHNYLEGRQSMLAPIKK